MLIFIYCKHTLHDSGVTAPIIRSNITWPDEAILQGISCTRIGTCTGECVYSFSTPGEGCCDTRNMQSDFAVNKYLHTFASGWIFINVDLSLISDRMSHIMMRICRWELALIVRAPTVNSNDNTKDNFYEELEQVFDQFRTDNMQILLGCRNVKFGREDRFKPTTWRDHIIWIHQTLEKKRE